MHELPRQARALVAAISATHSHATQKYRCIGCRWYRYRYYRYYRWGAYASSQVRGRSHSVAMSAANIDRKKIARGAQWLLVLGPSLILQQPAVVRRARVGTCVCAGAARALLHLLTVPGSRDPYLPRARPRYYTAAVHACTRGLDPYNCLDRTQFTLGFTLGIRRAPAPAPPPPPRVKRPPQPPPATMDEPELEPAEMMAEPDEALQGAG